LAPLCAWWCLSGCGTLVGVGRQERRDRAAASRLAAVCESQAFTRWPSLACLDARRSQGLAARFVAWRDDPADVRRQERAGDLDAGWYAHHVRIRRCWRGEPFLAPRRRKRDQRTSRVQ